MEIRELATTLNSSTDHNSDAIACSDTIVCATSNHSCNSQSRNVDDKGSSQSNTLNKPVKTANVQSEPQQSSAFSIIDHGQTAET